MFQKHPILSPDVCYKSTGKSIKFEIGNDSFELELDSLCLTKNVKKVLEHLELKELDLAKKVDLSPYSFEQLIEILDSECIITEFDPKDIRVFSGKKLICDQERYYYKHVLSQLHPDIFTQQLEDKSVSNETLLRWALQYSFITQNAESCIAASLINKDLNDHLREQLFSFFREEIGHQKLLKSASDYSKAELESVVVHVSTLSIVGNLLYYSIFDLPSFIAMVMMLEGNASDSQRYIDVLDSSDLGEEFTRGQKKHEQINIDACHGDEAREIAKYLPHISKDDIERSKRSIKNHVFNRQYMNSYLISGTYHPNLSKGFIRKILKENWGYLLSRTAFTAIANSNGKIKDQLVAMVSRAKIRNDCDIEGKSFPIIEMYCSAIWFIAYSDPEKYLYTISSIEGDKKNTNACEIISSSIW
ncbi:hypothetical protein FCV50_23385 [Vibrio kanaloae]|uniref:Iron-containing redox enzyme family protein n=1 Tax=Vibrio kanaloae TaxID=170673 RepID=A0A4U1YPV0_9VIBR|nr:hypothetical protein [Vibrio kanaloae]TKF23174.1 hypothetical protein FCV50_23385 [Vibrio kanaloae]